MFKAGEIKYLLSENFLVIKLIDVNCDVEVVFNTLKIGGHVSQVREVELQHLHLNSHSIPHSPAFCSRSSPL
jgi:hypothetical protein